jgi:hypothetical protein
MSLHVFWNWWNNYGDNLLTGSGLTYFGGFALGISYILSSLVASIMERMQAKKKSFGETSLLSRRGFSIDRF